MGLSGPTVRHSPVKTVWTPKTKYPNAASPTYHELHPEAAVAFHAAIGDAKRAHSSGAAVTQYPVDDYKNMRMFTTPEHDAGFALKGDDIVSVFKHPKAPYRNVTKSMLDLATSQGGKRLDAFDTVLPHLYGQSGFRAVARLPWDDRHQPDGWNRMDFKNHNGGRPDVVFMAHDPQAGSYQPGDGRMIQDYDEGEHHQRAALAHVAARGNVPAEPGPEAYGSGQLIRMANPLTVHHGTPHEFAPTRVNPLGEFNLSKLGTGEGAQAYGKGIYQAGNQRVAEGYRDDLSPGVTYQGKEPEYSNTDPHKHAAHQVAEAIKDYGLPAHEAIERIREHYKDSAASASQPWPNEPASQREAMRRRAQFHLAVSHATQRLDPAHFKHDTGQLYESELHIHPDHMLDWDKKISEHHPYVQHRVAALVKQQGISPEYARIIGLHDTATGELIHNHLMGQGQGRTNDKHAAAQALLQAGIPGIKYQDAGSRNLGSVPAVLSDGSQGWGVFKGRNSPMAEFRTKEEADAHVEANRSHNFVIFDPRTLNVVKRNGLPAMVDAGADALREHKTGIPP